MADDATSRFIAVAVLFEAGLGVAALAVGWFLERPPLAQVQWTGEAVLQGLAATIPMTIGLILVSRYPVGPFRTLDEAVRQLLIPMFRARPIWELLLISALAGFGEEFLFRGVIQAGLQQYGGSAWLALAVSALLFGAAHWITTTYAVLAGLIGVYLGWLWLATDNLLVPTIAHGAYDFVALVYLTRWHAPNASEDERAIP